MYTGIRISFSFEELRKAMLMKKSQLFRWTIGTTSLLAALLLCGCWSTRYVYNFTHGGLVEIHSPGRVYLQVLRQTEMGVAATIPEEVLRRRGVETLFVYINHGVQAGRSKAIVMIDSIMMRLDTSTVWKHLMWHSQPNGDYGGSTYAVIDNIEIPYRYPGEISLRFVVDLRSPDDSSLIDRIPIDLGIGLKKKCIDSST
jgi:hypothetical protein